MKPGTIRSSRLGLALLVTTLAASSLHADTLVYRNGREVQGRLVGLYGDTLEFEDARDGRIRRVSRRDVERIEFDDAVMDRPGNDWTSSPPGGPSPGMREREVLAYANTPWSDTGIDVRRGQIVYFRARGEVRWGPDRKDGPAGERNSPRNPNRPIPGRPGAALIGKIGDGSTDVFFIGDTTGPVRVQSSGRLYLGVNDDYLQDNRGFFTVVVSY